MSNLTLFESVDSTPGMVPITPDRLFTAWKLATREDVPVPDKAIHVDACRKHSQTMDVDYVVNFVYDYGFGSCSFC